MRKTITRALSLVLGSFAVYVGVACGVAASNGPAVIGDSGSVADTSGTADTGPFTSVDAMMDAILDALVDGGTPKDAMADTPPATSGSRIKAQYTVTTTADGASSKVFASWYDSTLKFSCNPGLAGDGAVRCVPTYSGVSSASAYLDSGCSMPLFLAYPGCTATVAGVADTSSTYSCQPILGFATKTRVYQVAATTPPAAGSWYTKSGTTCTQQMSAYPAPAGYLLLSGTEIAASALAPMTLSSVIE